MQRVAHLGKPVRHRTVVCLHRVTPQMTDLSLNAGYRRHGARPCSLCVTDDIADELYSVDIAEQRGAAGGAVDEGESRHTNQSFHSAALFLPGGSAWRHRNSDVQHRTPNKLGQLRWRSVQLVGHPAGPKTPTRVRYYPVRTARDDVGKLGAAYREDPLLGS
jgi:hypothetical protein